MKKQEMVPSDFIWHK